MPRKCVSIPTENQSKMVQQALFSVGIKWYGTGKKLWENSDFLGFKNGVVLYYDDNYGEGVNITYAPIRWPINEHHTIFTPKEFMETELPELKRR